MIDCHCCYKITSATIGSCQNIVAFVSKTIPIVTLWLRSPQAYCYLMVTLGQVTLNSRCFCPVPRARLYILPPRKTSVFACFARWQSLFIMCAPPHFQVVASTLSLSRSGSPGISTNMACMFYLKFFFFHNSSFWGVA